MAKIKGTNSDDRIVPSGSTPPAGKKKDDVSVPLAADTITRGNDRDTINNTKGIIVSFGNTPQAKDDLFTPADLTEGSLGTVILDVMGNDLGGAAKRLWSLDDGTSPGGIRPTDLLTQDPVGAANVSANGATIKITTDGKVSYDASTLSSAFTNNLQTLGAGEFATDTFTYAIRLANGALSWATATVQIAGGREKGTGYFSGDFLGRPRWRSVDSKSKVVAVTVCQSAVPKDCCRFTQVCRAVSSWSKSG